MRALKELPSYYPPLLQKRILSLVHYAHLAPSSRNRQPWLFLLGSQSLEIKPNLQTGCSYQDVYISLGCALENLVIAANLEGLSFQISIEATMHPSIHVDFSSSNPKQDPLFPFIESRHTPLTPFTSYRLSTKEKTDLREQSKYAPFFLIDNRDLLDEAQKQSVASDIENFANIDYYAQIKSGMTHTQGVNEALLEKLYFFASFHKKRPVRPYGDPSALGVLGVTNPCAQSFIMLGRSLERLYLSCAFHNLHLRPVARLLSSKEGKNFFRSLSGISKPTLTFFIGKNKNSSIKNARKALEEVTVYV